ncbi:MAG: hypothetical protein H6R26_1766 [Proteobacteria bacterium]|nr:hypothetical protein [Pseudomonadota bacterium]
MLRRLPEITGRWHRGQIADAAYAGIYFLLWQIERHGERFASRRHKGDPRPDAAAWLAQIDTSSGEVLQRHLLYWFGRYQFLGIIPGVPAALYHWVAGTWPLQLLERIPSPLEVLDMQAAGTRPVTVFSAFPRLFEPVLSKPDAFAFMVHDLEHAYKFLGDANLRDGQIAFFRAIRRCIQEGGFNAYTEDEVFTRKFDYLISDMNTHAMHSLQYLQAVLVDHHLRREGKQPADKVSQWGWQQITGLLGRLGMAELQGLTERALQT